MSHSTFSALPDELHLLAVNCVYVLRRAIAEHPAEPLRCCFVGNLSSKKEELLMFDSVSATSLQEDAMEAHLRAQALDADYVVTVLDLPGPPRNALVGIETCEATYQCVFPVVRKSPRTQNLKLGRAAFTRCKELPGPFDGLLPRRGSS